MRRSRTILLVEDNPDDVDLTLRAFQKQAILADVVVTRDGEDALDYLFATGRHQGRDASQNPAVVLLDLNLPKVSGLDVLRQMRSNDRTKRMPVVVLTSSGEERDIVESYAFGANSFVRKPVDFARFVEAARQLGVYWLELNEPPDAIAR